MDGVKIKQNNVFLPRWKAEFVGGRRHFLRREWEKEGLKMGGLAQ
jgi:hypothetical protein